jgi:cell wall-associated NlpC family hydrolase
MRPAALFLLSVCCLLGSASRLDAQSFPYLRTLLSGERTVSVDVREDMVRDSIVNLARQQIGTRYRLGATSPDRGFDCSGLVVYVMRHLGISLPRTAALQARVGEEIVRDRSELRPGDLLTFGRGSRISHVGIYSGNGRYIHASSGRGQVLEAPVPASTWWRGVRRLNLASDTMRARDGG